MTQYGREADQPEDELIESVEDDPAEVVDDDLSPPVDGEEIDDAVLEEAEVTLDDLFATDEVAKERDEYLDALRRVQADFDNYRKRVTRQQQEASERATESLLERLLPVLDALDLALEHVAPGEDSSEATALTQIASLLRDILSKEGLERIEAIDVAFDPTVHDAVGHLPRDEEDGDSGVVVAQVLRAGYQLKGRVVRPAMVQVRG